MHMKLCFWEVNDKLKVFHWRHLYVFSLKFISFQFYDPQIHFSVCLSIFFRSIYNYCCRSAVENRERVNGAALVYSVHFIP